MDPVERRVELFLRSYRTAFEQLDIARIAAHFAFPLHLASDAEAPVINVVPPVADWLPQLERLAAAYRTIGVRSGIQEETSIQAVSPRLCQVRVHWRLLDEAGNAIYQFTAAYTLADVQGELRIVALVHDELPRLRERLAQAARKS